MFVALGAFGYLMADATFRRSDLDHGTRWALAFPALVAFVCLLMVAHIVTRGAVFSHPWVVRGLTGLVAAALLVVRMRRPRRVPVNRTDAWALAGLTVLGLAVWAVPIFRVVPLDHTGDIPFHMGWASELVQGQATPTAPITGNIPNGYPWLYHALLAFVAAFTPGGRAYSALAPLQLLQVFGSIAGLFALGKQLTGRITGAVSAALLGAVAGGFGFLVARGPAIVMEPRARDATRFLGDLFFKRSYNVAFGNLSPPFPRDVAYALIAAFLLLLSLGLTRRKPGYLVGAGVVLGLIALTGAEATFLGFGIAFVICLLPVTFSRIRAAVCLFGPAIALWALWLIPMILSYLRFHGIKSFFQENVDLGPLQILGAWGIATPLAVWGAVVWGRRIRDRPSLWILPAVIACSAALIWGSRVFVLVFGTPFSTLERAHRYWPFMSLGVALFGALGLANLLDVAARRSKAVLAVLGIVTVTFAVASPLIATAALPGEVGPKELLTESLEGDEDTVLNLVAPRPDGGGPVLAIPPTIDAVVFSYTGDRMLLYVQAPSSPNPKFLARSRWPDIYEHVTPLTTRLAANKALITGQGVDHEGWLRLAAKFGIDLVVIYTSRERAEAFRGCDFVRASEPRVLVIPVASCKP